MVAAPGAPGPSPDSQEAASAVPAPEAPAPTASPSREAPAGSEPSPSPPPLQLLPPPPASPGAGRPPLRLVGWGGMAAAEWLGAGLARVLFYPTLLYTVFRGKMPGRGHRDWYHRIDPTVLLGALPLRSMTLQVSRAGRRARERPGRPSLSSPFASAAGPGRERARGDHHERGVRDEVSVQLVRGTQVESRGGCKSHHQDPVTHPHQTWPVASSQRVP
ncbi:phosphatidylglycerophosphatase and protein-tyrosine phosphatase 1 isoform X3 [Oryctolagus cuniculus]|uniref:phosphatidylglycerophosphatase and protein-tyrosine phosphatase 1 isoform X3 n=1 Tax=Oryctolagus cuniculus TaxID=9986 RepID=UPI003879454F